MYSGSAQKGLNSTLHKQKIQGKLIAPLELPHRPTIRYIVTKAHECSHINSPDPQPPPKCLPGKETSWYFLFLFCYQGNSQDSLRRSKSSTRAVFPYTSTTIFYRSSSSSYHSNNVSLRLHFRHGPAVAAFFHHQMVL